MGKLSFVAATIFAAAMALVAAPSSQVQARPQAPAPYLEPQAPISIETDAEIRSSEVVVPMTIEAPRRAAKTAKAAKAAAEDCETWRKGKIWGGKWRPLCEG